MHVLSLFPRGLRYLLAGLSVVLAGCAALSGAPSASSGGEIVYAVDARLELLRFHAAEPGRILERRRLLGLQPGESIAGLDFRVARGTLYALSTQGRLFVVDTATGILAPVGRSPAMLPLGGDGAFGVDFDSAADRIRVVGAQGLNLRLHPDTGAAIDGDAVRPGLQPDAPWTYAADDRAAGRAPQLVAAAYGPVSPTADRRDGRRSLFYGIDRATASLVAATAPDDAPTAAAIPDAAGRLRTIGPLGLGSLTDASFDIADTDGAALAAVRTADQPLTRLVRIDLASGRARDVGAVGNGEPLLGLAIAP